MLAAKGTGLLSSNLWEVALAKLLANGQQTPRRATCAVVASDIAELCALVAQQRNACEHGRWTFEFRGRQLISARRDSKGARMA